MITTCLSVFQCTTQVGSSLQFSTVTDHPPTCGSPHGVTQPGYLFPPTPTLPPLPATQVGDWGGGCARCLDLRPPDLRSLLYKGW